MTIPTAPPPAADDTDPALGAPEHAAAPTGAPRGAERFLLWVAGIGVARSEGWLGGVAAGIAARLRIDPLIVRGVLVVAALFGLPAIFLYAVAWALLPDADGRVHARDLLHRKYDPLQLGILVMALVGLIPTAPLAGGLFFGLSAQSWSALSVLGWIVGILIAGALVFLIVRAARRTPGASAPDLPMASADQAAPAASVPLRGSGTAEGADATSLTAAEAAPPTPPAPLPPGVQDPADVAAWRAQHTAWKEQDQAWRRRQQDAERAVRDQLRQERQATAAVFAAEAAERRRIRRASNPRVGFAFAAAVIGLAIVAGAAVGLWSDATGHGAGLGAALGLLAAALVLALGMIVAGAFRRRSGFLAFAAVLALTSGLVTGGVSSMQGLSLGYASVVNNRAAEVRQPFGELYIGLHQHRGTPRPITVEKGSGTTHMLVDPGVQLQLRATVGTATVEWTRIQDDTGVVIDSGVWTAVERGGESRVVEAVSSERTPTTIVQPVTIDQNSGTISVTILEPAKDEQ